MALGNTTQRVLVSLVAIPVIIAASYFGGIYFFVFTAFIAVVSFNLEWLTNGKDYAK